MINGVLVERTVKDFVPALKTNSEGLKKVLDDLVKQYRDKQEEMEKWKVWLIPSRDALRLDLMVLISCSKRTISKSSSSSRPLSNRSRSAADGSGAMVGD